MAKIFSFPSGEVIETIEPISLREICEDLQGIEQELKARGLFDAATSIHVAANHISSEILKQDIERIKQERA